MFLIKGVHKNAITMKMYMSHRRRKLSSGGGMWLPMVEEITIS